MLQTPRSPRQFDAVSDWEDQDPGGEDFLDLDRLLAAARRQARVVFVMALCGLALGAGYVATAVPLYTSSTRILIDKNQGKVVNELAAAGSVFQDDAAILSEVELLKSENISLKVADRLDLATDERFLADSQSIIGRVMTIIRAALDVSNWFAEPVLEQEGFDDRRDDATSKLRSNLEVRRVGRTYVLELSYTDTSPGEAARIARAHSEVYISDGLDSKFEATRRASTWLQERIQELKQQSVDADLAVQKFRGEHGLISVGGRLVAEQQLSEVNSQLIIVRAEVAQAKAKFERLQKIVENGDTNAVVNDSLVSTLINDLRKQYLGAAKLEAEITKKLGPNHAQAINLRSEMQEYEKLMFEELKRIAESYRSAYEVALTRQESLENSLAEAMGISATANTTQVTLRELEREADTYKNLYQTFLQRYQESLQQQSFPISEARVITQAAVPGVPSHPRKTRVLILALVLGIGAGAGLGAFREYRERYFRTGDQVRDELGLEFLGLTPRVKSTRMKTRGWRKEKASAGDIQFTETAFRHVVDNPLSTFAEALRGAKIAADIKLDEARPKVIGVVSCLPQEGKSTIATNLSLLIGSQGGDVLMIDGDLRNPGLTRSLARHAERGLVEAIMGEDDPQDLLLFDESHRVAMLPAVVGHRISHTSELLASPGMAAVLKDLGGKFGYVVVDLPPLAPVVDVKAFASRVDGFIFVVEWGRTPRNLVRSVLASNPMVRDKCLGVVLNKSVTSQMKYYREYGSSEYYYSRYSTYYRDDK